MNYVIRSYEKLFQTCAKVALATVLTATAITSCRSLPARTNGDPAKYARVEDHPDYERVEKRLHEAYEEAASHLNKRQRTVLEREQLKWASEREKERGNPDAFIADTEQNIRNLAGNYDGPY